MAVEPVQFVLLGILAAGGALLLYGGLALCLLLWFRYRTRSAGDALDAGVLAVDGAARAVAGRDLVYSPVTGSAALIYEYAIQHHVGSPATPDWRTVAGGQAGVPFDVETDAGRVRVDPGSATLELPLAEEVSFDADPDEVDREDPPYGVLRLAGDGERIVVGEAELVPGDTYRAVERRIVPGDRVRVAGVASRERPGTGDASGRDGDLVLRERRGALRQFLGVPYVIGDVDGGAPTQLRNRALVGLVFGLPLVMLSVVYLFPPGV